MEKWQLEHSKLKATEQGCLVLITIPDLRVDGLYLDSDNQEFKI